MNRQYGLLAAVYGPVTHGEHLGIAAVTVGPWLWWAWRRR